MEQYNEFYGEEINAKRFISRLLYKWKIITVVTIISSISFFSFTFVNNTINPTRRLYQATVKINIIVEQENATLEKDKATLLDDEITNKQAFIELTKSETVMNKVIQKLGLNKTAKELIGDLTVGIRGQSDIVSIEVINEDADIAVDIANTLKEESISFISGISERIILTGLEEARISDINKPNSSTKNLIINTIIGGIFGLTATVFILFIQYKWNKSIETSEDVKKYLDQKVLAVFPLLVDRKGKVVDKSKDVRSTI